MQFTKRLHEPIRAGVVTGTVRVWKRLSVKEGGRYALGQGYVVVDTITEIGLEDVTDELAIETGFENLKDLMKTARHGSGEHIFLIKFHYVDGDIREAQ